MSLIVNCNSNLEILSMNLTDGFDLSVMDLSFVRNDEDFKALVLDTENNANLTINGKVGLEAWEEILSPQYEEDAITKSYYTKQDISNILHETLRWGRAGTVNNKARLKLTGSVADADNTEIMAYDGEVEWIIINADSPKFQFWLTGNTTDIDSDNFISEYLDGDYNYKINYTNKTFTAGTRLRCNVGKYGSGKPKNVFMKIGVKYDLTKPLAQGSIPRDSSDDSGFFGWI